MRDDTILILLQIQLELTPAELDKGEDIRLPDAPVKRISVVLREPRQDHFFLFFLTFSLTVG